MGQRMVGLLAELTMLWSTAAPVAERGCAPGITVCVWGATVAAWTAAWSLRTTKNAADTARATGKTPSQRFERFMGGLFSGCWITGKRKGFNGWQEVTTTATRSRTAFF